MATITANITSSEGVIPTSAELENGHYTIDSENIYVFGTSRGAEGRAFDRLFASVERGVAGSTAASHTSGATLTRYYPDAAGGGGTAQTLSLLGPYPVAFDTPDIFTNGVLLDVLPAGIIVISSWAEGQAIFTGGTVSDASLEVWVGVQSEFSGVAIYTTNANGQGVNDTAQFIASWPIGVAAGGAYDRVLQYQVRTKTETDLYMWVDLTGANPTQGAADIYVLIGTPA